MIRIANIGAVCTIHEDEYRIIENAEVHIDGTSICYCGSQIEAPKKAFVQEIDAGQRVVTSGFIDAHTHVVFASNRANEFQQRAAGASYEQIAAGGGGIKSSVRATKSSSESELAETGLNNIRRMVRNGTTSVEMKSGYGLDPECEVKLLRASATAAREAGVSSRRTFLGLHAVPEGMTRQEHVLNVTSTQLYQSAWNECDYADIFVENGYFTSHDAKALALAASGRGKRLRLHVDQLSNGNGATLAAELGALTADHLEYTNQEGIQAMAKAEVIPVLLPASVHGLGKTRYPDARAMLAAGLPVVLATDLNPGSSPCFSLPFCMNLAMVYMKMSLEECIRGVTTNAARSLGLEKTHGQLSTGFNADLVIWDVKSPQEIPYWIGAELANTVFASGKLIYSKRS